MQYNRALDGPPPIPGTWRWDELRQRCLRETRRILGHREDAEEAAQEALLRAWRHRRRQTGGTPEAWVATIARREALRLLARRQAAYARRTADPDALDRLPSDAREHELALSSLVFDDTIGRLSEADQALARLHYQGDIGLGAIAAAMDLPEATVRVRIHRARARIRDEMRDTS